MWMLPASISRMARTAPATSRGEDAGGQAEGGAVGLGDGRLPVVGLADRDGRAEQLVLAERGRRVDVGDHRRGDHGAVPLAAGEDARPGLGGRGDRLLDPLAPRRWRSPCPSWCPATTGRRCGWPSPSGTSASRKSPLIAGCAITRCTEMQTWPALAKPPAATALDASSRSASGMITTGQDAPSSSDSFLTPARAGDALADAGRAGERHLPHPRVGHEQRRRARRPGRSAPTARPRAARRRRSTPPAPARSAGWCGPA